MYPVTTKIRKPNEINPFYKRKLPVRYNTTLTTLSWWHRWAFFVPLSLKFLKGQKDTILDVSA